MLKIKSLRTQKKFNQQQMAEFLGVTQATFSGWENGKYEPDLNSLKKMADIFNVSIDYLFGENDYQKKHANSLRIPVLGYVAAGVPIEAIEDIIDYEELDASQFDSNYDYFGLKIKGDSMSPRIQNGDVVIVRKQEDVESGEVAIVCVNGENATCKQVQKHTEGISLISYNAAYDIKFYSNKEIEELPITILGKVVELRGKF